MTSQTNPNTAPQGDATGHVTPTHDITRHGTTHHAASYHDDIATNITNTEAPNGAPSDVPPNDHSLFPDVDHQVFNSDTSTNVMTRQNTIQRDEPRQDMSQRGEARHDTLEHDQSRHDVSSDEGEHQPMENWVDIQQAEVLLREHGVSRTTRTIQRFCQKGDLRSRLVPTETGSRYIIDETSIEALAKKLRETLPGNNNLRNIGERPDAKNFHNPSENQTAVEGTISQDAHMQEIVVLKNQHIELLQSQLATANNQIAMKDEQIGEMLERDHETNHLIQNLQRMVGLPAGRSNSQFEDRSIDIDRGGSQNSNSTDNG